MNITTKDIEKITIQAGATKHEVQNAFVVTLDQISDIVSRCFIISAETSSSHGNDESVCNDKNPTRYFHGMSKHPLYYTWKRMVGRCYTESTSHFEHYGGRGIRVATRWMDFRNFVSDMGDSYRPNLSIDRIDPNGHYTPKNCRWVDKGTQAINKRNVRFVTIGGKRTSLAEIERETGIYRGTIAEKLAKGENIDDIISTTPKMKARKRPVIVNGIRYESGVDAAKAVGITKSGIYGWLKSGKATYDDRTAIQQAG